MGILQKLKSALGMDTGGRSRPRTEPDVTVEREPAAESERAVKTGAGDDGAAASASVDDESADPSTDADAAESAEPADPTTDADAAGSAESSLPADDAEVPDDPSPPVDEIRGIGPTYAERLASAGIETVADLADSDLETVVEAAQTNEYRAEDWLEQARQG